MVFNNNETLANLYEGITKQIDPSAQQSTRQAPTLNKVELSKDQDLLAEAYTSVSKKCTCMHAAKGCDCGGCDECKNNQEKIEEAKKAKKPAFLFKKENEKEDSKKTGKKKTFPFNKKEMEEGLNFKDMFNLIMNESSKQEVVCGTKINPQGQYNCVTEDGKEKTLKGESVVGMRDKLKSVKVAHKK